MEVKFPDKAIIKIKVCRSFANQNVIRDEYQSKWENKAENYEKQVFLK